MTDHPDRVVPGATIGWYRRAVTAAAAPTGHDDHVTCFVSAGNRGW